MLQNDQQLHQPFLVRILSLEDIFFDQRELTILKIALPVSPFVFPAIVLTGVVFNKSASEFLKNLSKYCLIRTFAITTIFN